MSIQQIDHVNLVVRDLTPMVAFYRDVLGLKVTKEVTISGRWIAAVVGLDDVLADVVYLEPPTGSRVELICFRHPEGELPPGRSQPNTHGIRHLAFRVEKIDEVVASLRRANARFFGDVQQVPDSQVTYEGGVHKRLVYFLDPEGNILEFCEYK